MAEVFLSPAPSGIKKWILTLKYESWYHKIKDRMRFLCGAPVFIHAQEYRLDCTQGATTITFKHPPTPGETIQIVRINGI